MWAHSDVVCSTPPKGQDMDTPPQDKIYIAALTLMQMIGEHFDDSSENHSIFRTVNFIIFSYLTVLNMVNFFCIDVNMIIKNAESSVVIVHVLMKYAMLVYYKPILTKLLCYKREKFWRQQDMNEDIRLACNKFFERIQFVQTCLVIAACTTITLYVLRPCFEGALILEVWLIRDTFGHGAALLMMEYYTFILTIPVMFGYDSLYLALCADVVVQVRLLKYKLKQLTMMNISDSKVELINCIKHHQFLQGIFTQMRRIYSVMFFFHYFITLAASCVELYELILGHLEVSRILSDFMNIFMLIFQFAYYAFPAEFVAAEFADISRGIYMSRWYTCELSTQKKLLFMMTRSQHLTYFSATGIIDINIETYGGLIRKIVSFYAVLRNLLST